MRRHTSTLSIVTLLAELAVFGTRPAPASVEETVDRCARERVQGFFEKTRSQEATLRVEVEVLDDDCGETVFMTVVESPQGEAVARGLAFNYREALRSVRDLRQRQPNLPSRELCRAVQYRTEKLRGKSSVPQDLAADLKALRASPVLAPLLVIHGIQYEVRIEAGVSESTFSFQAPGPPRSEADSVHPLERWSHSVRDALGLVCPTHS